MDRPLTEVQKFIKETQRQIDEEGLVGISGTHFDRGDKPFRVLKAKQFEYRIYSGGMVAMINPDGTQNNRVRKGKFASVALIAKDLNAMNQAMKDGNFTTLTFDDEMEDVVIDKCNQNRKDISVILNDSRKKGNKADEDNVETYIPTDRIANEAMSKAIANGRAKPLKFNDSTQKKPSPEAKKIIDKSLFGDK